MIYTVTFNPAIDYVVRMPHFCTGEVNRAQSEDVQFGGKGINVSVVLKNLGLESCALGFVAGFTGKAIDDGLQKLGVKTDFIRMPHGMTRINVKLKSECETEINGSGPDIGEAELNELFWKLDSLQPGDILVLAGSIPKSLPQDIYETILQRLEEKNIMAVVDATGKLLCNVLKYHPFLIKPNHHELGEIFDRELTGEREILQCASELQKRGARNVLVSMAGAGALLLDENGEAYRVDAPKGTVKNSVGAGDSMVAGFLAGYLESKDYKTALKLGAASGSATAFSDGLATKENIKELLSSLNVTKEEKVL